MRIHALDVAGQFYRKLFTASMRQYLAVPLCVRLSICTAKSLEARCAGRCGGKGRIMDSQNECNEDERVVKPRPKRPYTKPVLLTLGTFSELTQTVGNLGNNDGGHQRGRRSTRT